jgi:ankyrin repeat protein
MLKWAFKQCVTVDDFEDLLKQTNVSGRRTACNIGVIDAFGGAAIFETGNYSYTRFDATDPKVAPQGYIIRANFAFTGGGNGGRAKYECANQLWQQAIEKNELDYRYVLRKVCRDFSGAEEVSHTLSEMEATQSNTIKVLRLQNTVNTHATTYSVLFQGVRSDENPSLTTFWAILGNPIISVAIPSWVIAESSAPELDGQRKSPVCTSAIDLYLANYVTGDDKRRPLLNPEMLTEIGAITYPAEDKIFEQTEKVMAQWRQDYPTAQQVASFHRPMASEAMDTLDEVTGMLIQKDGPTASLRIALYMRDLEKAKTFIQQGVNMNMSDGHGSTPLHYAVQNNLMEIVQLLISKNADVNAKNRSGLTPLYIACDRSYKDIVELLLSKGANVNAANNEGNTLLHRAAQNGQTGIIELLITHGVDVNTKDSRGFTPLHSAKKLEVAELLIAKGADVNAKSENGRTPLRSAAKRGKKDIVEILLAKGADINAKDGQNRTPLRLAEQRNRKETVDLLRKHGAKE